MFLTKSEMRRSIGKERDYAHEKAYAAPHRGNTTQKLQGRDDDRDRSWDTWSHYCTLNEAGEVADRGRFRTYPSGVDKRFRDLEPVRIAMEAGTHSIWITEQIEELGHEVIVANVRELRAISHSDQKSDKVDAEKLARYARLDLEALRPIAHRTVAQQEILTLIRARDVLVRLRTGAVNSVRDLAKPCGTGCRLHPHLPRFTEGSRHAWSQSQPLVTTAKEGRVAVSRSRYRAYVNSYPGRTELYCAPGGRLRYVID
jgi:hypothetical protein